MSSLLLALIVTSPRAAEPITRSEYGVPHIHASNLREAFFHAGYAVAEDRLWQMEMSRRLAGGRLSEVLGPQSLASDREAARTMYTDAELTAMFAQRSATMQTAWTAYAEGINAWIANAKAKKLLPKGYEQNKFEPAPWSVLDSAKIATMMGRRFGAGGGLEITLWAALQYLQSQPGKARALDIVDDLAPQNDTRSLCTVEPKDEAQCSKLQFGKFTRADTVAQLTALPKTSLFELLPAARLATMEDFHEEADRIAVAAKWGSYAIVAGKDRSRLGFPLLLGAPQMGLGVPSVVHEMTIDCPELRVTGLNVPGVPGVIIGNTPTAAWTLTTAVADTQDVFVQALADSDHALYNGKPEPIGKFQFEIPVRGAESVKETQRRTRYGPVLLSSNGSKAIYSLRTSFWKREMESYDAMFLFGKAASTKDFQQIAERMTLGFNLFYATKQGDIGWNFCGLLPIRANGLDPRLPTPGTPQNDWKDLQVMAKSLHLVNPQSGVISNWNNKPISWFPNLDTPYWFAFQHVQNLRDSIPSGKLSPRDLEQAAWQIARREDDTGAKLLPQMASALAKAKLTEPEKIAANYLVNWDGWATDGSLGAWLYRSVIQSIREELFQPVTGNFLSADTFSQVVHGTVIRDALAGKTTYPYLGNRNADQVILAAFRKTVAKIPQGNIAFARYQAPRFPVPNGFASYSNRGTFIQIVELGPTVAGRSVNSPGVAESGPHSDDQTPLSREWRYKLMNPWISDR